MAKKEYRNRLTGTVYKEVHFNNTPIATVVTWAGSVFNVEAKHLEEVKPTGQVDIFTRESEADKVFREFHEKNPQVYRALVGLAQQMHERGRKKIGMQMLLEVLRWNTLLQTSDPDFKINNNYGGRYARLIMSEHPEFDGMFELRTLRS